MAAPKLSSTTPAAPVAAGADGAGADALVYGAADEDAGGGGATVPVAAHVLLPPGTGYGAADEETTTELQVVGALLTGAALLVV